MNRGEDREQWARNFVDNSTSGGSNSVLTDVGLSGGWSNSKGANAGRYNSKGLWTSFKKPAKRAVVGARGDDVTNSDYKTYAPIDRPSDLIVVNGRGTDRGVSRTNTTQNFTIGTKPPVDPWKTPIYKTVPPRVNYRPGGYNSNGGTYVVSPITPMPWQY